MFMNKIATRKINMTRARCCAFHMRASEVKSLSGRLLGLTVSVCRVRVHEYCCERIDAAPIKVKQSIMIH